MLTECCQCCLARTLKEKLTLSSLTHIARKATTATNISNRSASKAVRFAGSPHHERNAPEHRSPRSFGSCMEVDPGRVSDTRLPPSCEHATRFLPLNLGATCDLQ